MNRSTLVLVGLILISTLACRPSADSGEGSTAAAVTETEILWDEWGAPHIYANSLEGLFYAQGWAQAKNHGDLVLRLYGESRGRAAEYWGEDWKSFFGQPALESDRWVHTMGIPERAASWFEELVSAKLFTSMLAAERVLDDLEAAAVDHGSQRAKVAWAVLAAWDRNADADSRGAVLFAAFARELRASGSEYAEEWDESRPLETPDGFADPKAAVAALERAAEAVEKEYLALDVAWGDVFRVRRGGRDLPANGGPGSLGIFRVLGSRPADDGKQVGFAGDTYVAIVEFSDPVRAATLLSYGNASQPASPHNGDQLELFSRKEMRTAWRSREQIEAHLEEREVLPR